MSRQSHSLCTVNLAASAISTREGLPFLQKNFQEENNGHI